MEDFKDYLYDFIPYIKIGPIALNKNTDLKDNFKPTGVKWLNENGFNHVLCNGVFLLDGAETIRRYGNKHDTLTFIYENKKLEVTCYFEKFINRIKNICSDIKIVENDKYLTAFSDSLGIIINAEIFNYDTQKKIIRSIIFCGKNEYKMALDIILNS